MPTTEIPPRTPSSAQDSRPSGGELYDAGGWESAYLEAYDAPALLVQLQDDLSRSRQREAFWMSVVVHLTAVILVINLPRLENLWPKSAVVVVSPGDQQRQKELTYLELPPDEQKVTKRPDTDKISDQNRIAKSRAPQLNRDELKKILDSSRQGRPGPSSPPSPPQSPSPGMAAPNTPPTQSQQPQQQQEQAQQSATPPPQNQNQMAKLQMPNPAAGPKPSFNTNPLSAGSAIEQAARAAIANRGYGGDAGDFGLGQGKGGQVQGQLEVLSDTMGVDFAPYLSRIVREVRENWYREVPPSVEFKKGKLAIEFAILKDGRVAGMQLTDGSGDTALDRAAWAGITLSNPFPPLPAEFNGKYLSLRFRFYYNLQESDLK
jgi:TonB family protein